MKAQKTIAAMIASGAQIGAVIVAVISQVNVLT